jgi:hypothetical protein
MDRRVSRSSPQLSLAELAALYPEAFAAASRTSTPASSAVLTWNDVGYVPYLPYLPNDGPPRKEKRGPPLGALTTHGTSTQRIALRSGAKVRIMCIYQPGLRCARSATKRRLNEYPPLSLSLSLTVTDALTQQQQQQQQGADRLVVVHDDEQYPAAMAPPPLDAAAYPPGVPDGPPLDGYAHCPRSLAAWTLPRGSEK